MNGEHSREAVAEIISLNVRYIKYLTLREICNLFWISGSQFGHAVEDLTDQFMGGEIDIEKFKSEILLHARIKTSEKIIQESLDLQDFRLKRLEGLFRILEREDL